MGQPVALQHRQVMGQPVALQHRQVMGQPITQGLSETISDTL
jgi:hypothetical protein